MLTRLLSYKNLLLILTTAVILAGLTACQGADPGAAPVQGLVPTFSPEAVGEGCGLDLTITCEAPTGTPAPTETPKKSLRVPDRVSLEDARQAYDDQSAVFVDVRSIASFKELHIPGALSLPSEMIGVLYKDLDPNDWIILYCT
jgi:hypothetical protein